MKNIALLLLPLLGAAFGQGGGQPVIQVEAWRLERDYAAAGPNLVNRYTGRWVVTEGAVEGIAREGPGARCAAELLIDRSISACVRKDQEKWLGRAAVGAEAWIACVAGPTAPDGAVYLDNCLARVLPARRPRRR